MIITSEPIPESILIIMAFQNRFHFLDPSSSCRHIVRDAIVTFSMTCVLQKYSQLLFTEISLQLDEIHFFKHMEIKNMESLGLEKLRTCEK